MTDERLRELERRWAESQAVEDEAALLVERQRIGAIDPGRLDLLAQIGHAAARLARGLERLDAPPEASPTFQNFTRRLAETIIWCETRGVGQPFDFPFRSAVLVPPTLSRSRETWTSIEEARQRADLEAHAASVASARASILHTEGWPSLEARSLAGGRLLLFDPDGTLSDGAAEAASRKFFNADNVPAWDTWVTFVRGVRGERWTMFGESYLVCWIPSWSIDRTHEGVWVNPEDCIAWVQPSATEADRPLVPFVGGDAFAHELARSGLVAAAK